MSGIAPETFASKAELEAALARAVDAAIEKKFADKEWLAEKLMASAESPRQRASQGFFIWLFSLEFRL